MGLLIAVLAASFSVVSAAPLHFSHMQLRGARDLQTPGLSPSALFSSVFFNQLAANLKNATSLLQQLKSENASLVVNTNGPREASASAETPCTSRVLLCGTCSDCRSVANIRALEEDWDLTCFLITIGMMSSATSSVT